MKKNEKNSVAKVSMKIKPWGNRKFQIKVLPKYSKIIEERYMFLADI